MKQPVQNRVGLARRVLYYAGKRWFFKCVIALCAAVVLSLSAYQSASRTSATVYMALNYENAERGLYPNSTRFNMNDVISEDVAQKVIDRAGLQGQMTVSQLVNRLSIKPRYTRSTLERYIGSEYVVSLRLAKPLAGATANDLLMLLCEAYYEEFVDRFASNDVLGDFALIEPDGYDYQEIAYLFKTRVSHLNDYLSRRRSENGVFRSQTTGETYSSLIKRIDNFDSVLYERYRSFIIESGVAKDYETYTAELKYRQSLLQDEYDRAYKAYSLRLAAIDLYDSQQTAVVMIPTYDENKNFYMSKTRVGMDYIAEQARASEEYANTLKLDLLGSELKIDRLQAASASAGAASDVAKANDMIDIMRTELNSIVRDVTLTDDDYIRYTLSQALSFHPRVAATVELYGVRKAALAFVALYIGMSVAQQIVDEFYVRHATKRRVIDLSDGDKEGTAKV